MNEIQESFLKNMIQ